MYKYDPKSSIADEFINDAEILESLAYARENKANKQVIDAILQKARDYEEEHSAAISAAERPAYHLTP